MYVRLPANGTHYVKRSIMSTYPRAVVIVDHEVCIALAELVLQASTMHAFGSVSMVGIRLLLQTLQQTHAPQPHDRQSCAIEATGCCALAAHH